MERSTHYVRAAPNTVGVAAKKKETTLSLDNQFLFNVWFLDSSHAMEFRSAQDDREGLIRYYWYSWHLDS